MPAHFRWKLHPRLANPTIRAILARDKRTKTETVQVKPEMQCFHSPDLTTPDLRKD
jgi:hypothetical protein